MPVVSISMPESLLDRLDEFIEDHGYSGRSEAMREGARGLFRVDENVDWNSETDGQVIVYEYQRSGCAATRRHMFNLES